MLKKKNIFAILLVLLLTFSLTGCVDKNSDAYKFKKEYESYNNEKNSNGKEYRTVKIPNDNPFIYKTADEIAQMMENRETFVVYFGFSTCPWCRSVLSTLIDVAKDNNLEKIYYVDVLDIRDTRGLDETGNVITSKEGTEGYYKLINLMSAVLSDYTISTEDGNSISAGEKRIYAPNVVAVMNGKADKLETGISDKQTDGYMDLTDEMKNDTYKKLECVIKCVTENNQSCTISGC